MNDAPSKNISNLTALSAMGLALCSCALSISFGVILGHGLFLKFIFGITLLCVAIAEFVSAFYLAKAWISGHVVKIGLAGWLLIGGIAVSVICGQATLQQSLDAAQQERRIQSDVYQAAMAQRESAAEKVASLSIDEAQALAATSALTTLVTKKEDYLASRATNMGGKNAGTIGARVGDCAGTGYYARKYCGKVRSFDQQMNESKAIVAKWNEYQSAKAHLASLESKPLPIGAKESQLPGISALALVLKADGEEVGAVIFLSLAIFTETSAIILFFFLGSSVQPPTQNDYTTYNTQPHVVQPQSTQAPKTPVLGVQNADVYQQIVNDIQAKRLPNGSYRTLMNKYSLNQNQAEKMRLQIISDGFGRLNRRNEIEFV